MDTVKLCLYLSTEVWSTYGNIGTSTWKGEWCFWTSKMFRLTRTRRKTLGSAYTYAPANNTPARSIFGTFSFFSLLLSFNWFKVCTGSSMLCVCWQASMCECLSVCVYDKLLYQHSRGLYNKPVNVENESEVLVILQSGVYTHAGLISPELMSTRLYAVLLFHHNVIPLFSSFYSYPISVNILSILRSFHKACMDEPPPQETSHEISVLLVKPCATYRSVNLAKGGTLSHNTLSLNYSSVFSHNPVVWTFSPFSLTCFSWARWN